jgi:VCBS repeat-containing protein
MIPNQEGGGVVRFNPDGSVDTNFAGGRAAQHDAIYDVFSIAFQDDGKIILAGKDGDYAHNATIARFNTDGSPDLSFKVTTYSPYVHWSDGGGTVFALGVGVLSSGVAIQGDGILVLVGPNPHKLVRLFQDGNAPPVAEDDSASTSEDSTVTISVLANDHDRNRDRLTVASTTAPAHGSVVVNQDGTIRYRPAANFHGLDNFDYTISDGRDGTASATVTVTVAPENDPPVAQPDSTITSEDMAVRIHVLANDQDPDGDTLTVLSVTAPAHGSAVINPDGTISYTPAKDFNGTDSFGYTIGDGQGEIANTTVTVVITPVNDTPVAADDAASTYSGLPITVFVLANDRDVDGDRLTVTSITAPAHGTARLSSDGTIHYTSNRGFTGADGFHYTISDGHGGTSEAGVVVMVNPSATIGLENDSWNPGRTALVARGTAGNDVIRFTTGSPNRTILVWFNGQILGEFQISQISRLVAYGLAGDDLLAVSPAITISSQLVGGAGNDTLRGGNGNDVLLGSAGNDFLDGRDGRDFLIGGLGADLLQGGNDTDLLLGGRTSFQSADTALHSIMTTWASSRTYDDRVSRLITGTNGLPKLDATTVLDDGAIDNLTGGLQRDWLCAKVGQDVLTDLSSSERLN